MSWSPPDGPGAEAPADPGLLTDALERLEQLFPDPDPAIEELEHLLARMPRVGRERQRRRALRRVAELLATGEYQSVRAAAPRVACEVGAASETVRGWVSEAGGIPPRAA